jgi:hypothetical protein
MIYVAEANFKLLRSFEIIVADPRADPMLLSIYPPQAIILFLPSSTSIDYPV